MAVSQHTAIMRVAHAFGVYGLIAILNATGQQGISRPLRIHRLHGAMNRSVDMSQLKSSNVLGVISSYSFHVLGND